MTGSYVGNGCVLLDGPRFDLARVLDASERVLDALAGRIGRGEAYVTMQKPPFTKRIPWPEPGKAVARGVWHDIAQLCEVVDESVVHRMNDLTAKAFLLGKTWCVRHPDGRLTMPDLRTSVDELDPTPTICLYGEPREDEPFSYAVLPVERMRAIRAVLRTVIRDPLELKVVAIRPSPEAKATHEVGFLRFPHEHYGTGRGPIRVRCVDADDLTPDPGPYDD